MDKSWGRNPVEWCNKRPRAAGIGSSVNVTRVPQWNHNIIPLILYFPSFICLSVYSYSPRYSPSRSHFSKSTICLLPRNAILSRTLRGALRLARETHCFVSDKCYFRQLFPQYIPWVSNISWCLHFTYNNIATWNNYSLSWQKFEFWGRIFTMFEESN